MATYSSHLANNVYTLKSKDKQTALTVSNPHPHQWQMCILKVPIQDYYTNSSYKPAFYNFQKLNKLHKTRKMGCLVNESVIVINQRKDNSRDKPEAELNLFCSTVSPLFCCFPFHQLCPWSDFLQTSQRTSDGDCLRRMEVSGQTRVFNFDIDDLVN